MAAPLVSIVLPVRDSARTLELAIRSVLAQTYRNWELLVIDDGSVDESPAIVGRFEDSRIHLIFDGQHRGLAARLNQGIDLARGEYLARMDGDDVSFPMRLQKQLEFLQSHRDVDLVGSRAIVFTDNGHPIGNLPFRESHEMICKAPWRNFDLPHPTWMGRIEWFRRFHYGIPEAVRCEDQELLLRAYPTSRYACLPDLLLGYRRNSFSLKKSFPTRFHLAAMHLRLHLANHRYAYALMAVGFHTAKAGVDVLRAMLSGTQKRASRFLATANQADTAQWSAVWNNLK
jgi:glycosyltransferase involved in cell wall biosynthesis